MQTAHMAGLVVPKCKQRCESWSSFTLYTKFWKSEKNNVFVYLRLLYALYFVRNIRIAEVLEASLIFYARMMVSVYRGLLVVLLLLSWLSRSISTVFILPGVYEQIQGWLKTPLYTAASGYVREKNDALRRYRISSEVEFMDMDFTPAERSHLKDVKIRVLRCLLLAVVSSCVGVLVAYYTPSWLVRSLGISAIKRWVGVSVGLSLILWLLWFEKIFSMFHNLFFTDNRIFPEDSLLIQLYPASFFFVSMILIFLLTILFVVMMGFFLIKIRSRRNKWEMV